MLHSEKSAASMMTLDHPVTFETHPSRYRHWRMSVEGQVATLTLDVAEDAGIRPGYKLKLNSYDLGVDIELNDALQRIRFEYPAVRVVIVASAKDRVFCSGANIYMLGSSSHSWKVNFCKFTNETRNGMEDSSAHSGLKFLAACSGSTAGGGYELALACDEIVMIDDRSSTVSLPEVSLLGVLPGTGGLTRLTDKRRVRHDLADLFCTTSDGVRAMRAKEWGLVDEIAKPAEFDAVVRRSAARLAERSERPTEARGIALEPLGRTAHGRGFRYEYVDVAIDAQARTAELTVRAPNTGQPANLDDILALGAGWWPLQVARELDDAILSLRTNHSDIGTWIVKTRGNADRVRDVDAALFEHRGHWFAREVIGMLRRTLARLDVTARSLFATIDRGSCFAGSLFELALCADRTYMLLTDDDGPSVALSALNFGAYPALGGRSRLAARFYGDDGALARLRAALDERLGTEAALALGLVTAAPDELDWDDELRVAVEERTSMSPDALTGLEANLRFGGDETMATRIFGRLSAWQNWVFTRPNAVGESGALKVFGTGAKPAFDRDRT